MKRAAMLYAASYGEPSSTESATRAIIMHRSIRMPAQSDVVCKFYDPTKEPGASTTIYTNDEDSPAATEPSEPYDVLFIEPSMTEGISTTNI